MDKQNYLVGLDIGTTKISAIVGRMNEYGKLEILGMGRAESLGVMRGQVANIDKTVNSIQKAVAEAEAQSGIEIEEVYVGIAGRHISSLQHRGSIIRENPEEEISKEDILKLKMDMQRLAMNPGESIIHVLPQDFIVDSEPGIKDPVGMAGSRLEANFHIITGQQVPIRNIKKSVEKAGLIPKALILEPLASAASVLSDEEKEAGVALVDIGGGTTDIAIFVDEIIRHTAVIPFGGNAITEDIREGCMIMRKQAERLKIKYGSAVPMEVHENQIITIPGLKGREPKEISRRNLANIIKARMEEILDFVKNEIYRSGFKDKLYGGIVLTGGGAKLSHCKQLVEYCTGLDAKIGLPIEHLARTDVKDITHPMYATGVGLILKGFELEMEEQQKLSKTRKAKKKRGYSWLVDVIRIGEDFFNEKDREFK